MLAEISIADDVRPSCDSQLAEEQGTLWLWAKPQLLAWHCDISWLFSPVTGNTLWPGDLWGIDEDGSLLLVEAKVARPGGADPFRDFIPESHVRSKAEIERRWRSLLHAERAFITDQIAALDAGQRAAKLWRGVVPYSCRREAIWRWSELYRRDIVPLVLSPEQEGLTVARLNRFAASAHASSVRYIGLLVGPPTKVSLSPLGLQHYSQLTARAGRDNVLLRHLHGEVTQSGLLLRAWTCKVSAMSPPAS